MITKWRRCRIISDAISDRRTAQPHLEYYAAILRALITCLGELPVRIDDELARPTASLATPHRRICNIPAPAPLAMEHKNDFGRLAATGLVLRQLSRISFSVPMTLWPLTKRPMKMKHAELKPS
jgi:hypothetical protein